MMLLEPLNLFGLLKHCPVTEQWQESDDGTSAHWVRIDT